MSGSGSGEDEAAAVAFALGALLAGLVVVAVESARRSNWPLCLHLQSPFEARRDETTLCTLDEARPCPVSMHNVIAKWSDPTCRPRNYA